VLAALSTDRDVRETSEERERITISTSRRSRGENCLNNRKIIGMVSLRKKYLLASDRRVARLRRPLKENRSMTRMTTSPCSRRLGA
jgi:hypothetical protein